MTPHLSTARAGSSAAISSPATAAAVRVSIPWQLLADVTRRWPGWTLDEKVNHALGARDQLARPRRRRLRRTGGVTLRASAHRSDTTGHRGGIGTFPDLRLLTCQCNAYTHMIKVADD
jgi:hypothetical protein